MVHQRPRRASRSLLAIRPALAKRILKIGVPGLMIAGLATGTAVAVWPDHQLTAEPGTTSSVAAPAQGMRSDRPNRDSERAALPDTSASASAAAEKSAAAKAAAAKKSAAAKEAAAQKAAEEKAAEKKAAAKKAAEKKAAAELAARKKAAAEQAAKKKAAALADFAELGDSDGTKYATSEVNVRVGAGTDYDAVATVDEGDKVKVTDRRDDGWTQIDLDGKGRWIRSDLLTTKEPVTATSESDSPGSDQAGSDQADSSESESGGISGAACSSGSAVESGLTPDAIKVHRAICAKFPQVTSFGGVRADSMPEHPSGRALDSMISDSSVGWEIANWARAHHQELGISQVIYSQQIWTVQRGSEGWRSMPDRGSASANHYDHVHVTVYGNSAG